MGLEYVTAVQAVGVTLSTSNFLMKGLVYIPFVGRLGNGKTPVQYPLFSIIGGENYQGISSVVPGSYSLPT